MTQALVLQQLSKAYGKSPAPALDDVSLTLEAGTCTAVLGPSGSGKSTLLRTAAGLEIPDRGTVLLEGQDLAGVRPEQRRMAMVFQRPLLFPHLNVLDNVAFAATVRGTPKKRARADAQAYLELVQMEDLGNRAAAALSGGQQQRVAIARALAARPAVLLLDEPFSALDPALRSAMHELLAQVREKLNPTILMVTHDHDEAAAVADRIALLQAGRLLQHDRIDALYTRPATLQVSRLMGGTNEIPGTVKDGMHYSVLGAHALPADQQWPDGTATLIIRQERIILVPNHSAGTPAVVSGIRSRGPRHLVTVTAAGVELHTEATPSHALSIGDGVRVQLPTAALAAVGADTEPRTAPLTSPDWKVLA